MAESRKCVHLYLGLAPTSGKHCIGFLGSTVANFFRPLTICVGEVELRACSFLEHIIRGHVALEGDKMAAAPGCQQTHAPMKDGLHRVSVGG